MPVRVTIKISDQARGARSRGTSRTLGIAMVPTRCPQKRRGWAGSDCSAPACITASIHAGLVVTSPSLQLALHPGFSSTALPFRPPQT